MNRLEFVDFGSDVIERLGDAQFAQMLIVSFEGV
jgi:hypothetical protein